MGGKPKPKKLTEEELRAIVKEMGSCLVWVLTYCKFPSGMMFNEETGIMRRAEERIFDVLDRVGHVVDRDKYYNPPDKKTKKRRENNG